MLYEWLHMKRAVWFAGYLLGMVLLLAGCGRSMDGSLWAGMELPKMTDEPESVMEAGREKIIYVPEEAEVMDHKLRFGSLVIHLPEEASVHILESTGEKGQALELPGMEEEKAAPPRIRLVHYQVRYESEIELASAVLKEISGEMLSVIYTDFNGAKGWDYGFEMEDGVYRKHILVKGNEAYLLEEVQAEWSYSVSRLLEENSAGWMISEEGEPREEMISYSRRGESQGNEYIELIPEEGLRFVALNGSYTTESDLSLYKEGEYENPCQSFPGRFYSRENMRDLNFDGYVDLRSKDCAYLWNHEKQCYEMVLFRPEDDLPDFMDMEFFEEQKTLHSMDRQLDEDWNLSGEKEGLWQWEGNHLILKRKWQLEISEDTVNVRIQEGEKILLNHMLSYKKWEENKELLQPFYEQFYQDLAPENTYEQHHGEGTQKCISGKLLDKIAQSLPEKQKVLEILKPLTVGRVLTEEEVCALAREHMEIRVDLAEAVYNGSCTILEADIDNDGIPDLMMEKDWGGSGGFTDSILYQGQKGGGYIRTSTTPQLWEDWACISYEGKNYVYRTAYDYRRKEYNGISLYYYEEGELAEEVSVKTVLDSYQVQVLDSAGEQWMTLAEAAAAKSPKLRERIEDNEILIGNAEQELVQGDEIRYCSDLDNDGEPEEYEKTIWLTSSMGSVDHLSFSGGGEEVVGDILRNETNSGIMLWVDEEKGENIIFVMYLTGLYDYETAGYLVKEDAFEQVCRIQGKAKVRAEIYR